MPGLRTLNTPSRAARSSAEGDDDGDAGLRQGGRRERQPEPVERAEFPRQDVLDGFERERKGASDSSP